MSSYDYVLGADLANMQAGGSSFFDSAADFATKGVGAALVSGLYGLVNTGVDISNKVFGTTLERADTLETLNNVDVSWGDYYQKNKEVIDVGGFIASSLIPGTLAVKGLKMAQAGNFGGATGRILGYTTVKEAQYLNASLRELATEGGTIFTRINVNKAASIGWGVADNVLQAAAFEIGVAASMKASPILDEKSWSDISKDIATTSLIGGAIGGAIGGIFTNKLLKDAGKAVDKEARKYDVLENIGKLNLEKGDEAYSIVDALFKLPTEVLQSKVKLTHGRAGIMDELDVSGLMDRKLRDSVQQGVQKFEGTLTNIVQNDVSVGAPFAKALVNILKEGIESRVPQAEIRRELESKLLNLHSVEAIGNKPLDVSGELRYLNPRGDFTKDGSKVFSSVAFETPLGSTPIQPIVFRVVGDESNATKAALGIDAASKEEAFKKGFDFAFEPIGGKVFVNPNSKIYMKAEDDAANFSPMFFNTATKKTSFDVVPTIADVATAGKGTGALAPNIGGISSGAHTFAFKTNDFTPIKDSVEATARHLWAAKLPRIFGEVRSDDISVLDAMMHMDATKYAGVKIKDVETGGLTAIENINLNQFVFKAKHDALLNMLNFDTSQPVLSAAFRDPSGKLHFDYKGTLHATVLPKIEKQGWSRKDLESGWQVDFGNGKATFVNAVDAESFNSKEEFISFAADKLKDKAKDSIDLREIAYRINASNDFILNALEKKLLPQELAKHEGWIQDPARYAERENLIVRYNTAHLKDEAQFPDALVAYHARVQEAMTRTQDAFKAVLGEKADLFQDIESTIARTADSQQVGAGMVTSSNANYADRFRSWLQNTGVHTANVAQERSNEAMKMLAGPAARLQQNPAAAAEVAAATTAGRLSPEPMGLYQDTLSRQWMMVDLESLERIAKGGEINFSKRIPLSDEAGEFLNAHHTLHQARVEQQKVLAGAQGTAIHWNPNRLYFPPVDTQRVPFFAFVHQTDGTVFGSSEVAMLTARDAGELQRLAAEVQKDLKLKVIFKSNTEDYHKAKGDYEFARTMNDPVIDSTLRSQGKLGTYLPNMTPQAVIEDYLQFTQRAETKLVRDAVSVRYAQPFAELADLSKKATEAQTSKFEGLSRLMQRNVTDPFDDAIKLALNISKRSEFTLWHQANEFVDALGTRAWRGISSAFDSAKEGKISWEEANRTLEKFGLGAHFTDKDAFMAAQSAPDRNLLAVGVRKANMLLANGMLRLDFANSLLNIVSTPILLGTEVSSIRNSIKHDPELAAVFASKLGQRVPGTELSVPSTTKLLMNAISNRFGDTGKELMERYRAIGSVKGKPSEFYDMMDELSLIPGVMPSKYAQAADKWIEKGSKITFNTQAEELTRFVSADVMRQMTDDIVKAGKMTVQEQNNYINIFVNRVQGNYVASQRPMLFQGTIGAAVGLFQTYQFNMFQQLYRHIENRDMKTLAVAAGLQGTLFGANGLPFFAGVNTHIIGNASINAGHEDMYSYAVKAMGKDVGDWMMYGTASAMPLFSDQAPALWTRGDLNPRYVTMVPTDFASVPAVQASMKVVNAAVMMAKQISQGSDMLPAVLHGLEHNGLNRPLAGLAQVLKGDSTTTKGNLISASQDWFSIASASRLIGAKPMEESVALNEQWRSSAYKAVTKERIDLVGSVVKEKLRGNQQLTTEDWLDFQGRYAAAGGRIQGFSEALRRWDKGANRSVVNELMRHNQTMAGQRMIEIMGGDPLEDYSRLGITE